jgi:ribosomal protein S18 acetylase RimI-like enzyme
MVRTGLLLLPFKVGWSGFWRMMNLNSRLDKVREQQVPEPHWYLMALGVAPSRQGQGIGSDLLQPILTHADAESQLCYLETFSERNLTFYERQGFEVQENGRIPHGGPAYWTMIRQPQA